MSSRIKSPSKPLSPVCSEHFAVQPLYNSLRPTRSWEKPCSVGAGCTPAREAGALPCKPNMPEPEKAEGCELVCTGRGGFWFTTQPPWVTDPSSAVERQAGLSCGCLGAGSCRPPCADVLPERPPCVPLAACPRCRGSDRGARRGMPAAARGGARRPPEHQGGRW